ncbi:MAG: hypothetical protein ACKOCH_18925, partial [Bacteroidota bacterium]
VVINLLPNPMAPSASQRQFTAFLYLRSFPFNFSYFLDFVSKFFMQMTSDGPLGNLISSFR